MKSSKLILSAAAVALSSALPLSAAPVSVFHAKVDGSQEPVAVSTAAKGRAQLKLDKTDESLTFKMTVLGLTKSDLLDVSGLGPVHLHLAVAGVNGPVVVPFAYGNAKYWDGGKGFRMKAEKVAFADLNITDLTFMDFLQAVKGGGIYVNVHTAENSGGEVRGQFTPRWNKSQALAAAAVAPPPSPVPVPASAALLLGGLGGLVAMRRRKKA
ncbi:MAG: CHRD domain-containing protein [Pseudooceanicola sp.]|nr:CHRD domain-containing protein [Pseudooceanicola sp.]